MKSKLFLFLGILLAGAVISVNVPAFAEETEGLESSAVQISAEKLGNVSANCGSIRQSLKLLQRSDSRARTYFGAIYETASSKYITPLNLRLVKNDLSSVSLINLQASLSSTRTDFSNDFIDYSKSLEELIALDCRLEPEEFYEKLVETRKKRAIVAEDMRILNDLLTNSVKSVEKLKDDLKKGVKDE